MKEEMIMKIAIVRVRGIRNMVPKIKKTLQLLRLNKPNHCVLVEDTPQTKGMLNVVKDYATFGPVSEDTVFRLLFKRGTKGASLLRNLVKEDAIKKSAGEIYSGKKVADYADPVFRLPPPSKGYKDIRRTYPQGDLGKREELDTLLRRMI
jgi:large subunit ribosomal protein L30